MAANMDFITKPIPSGENFNRSVQEEVEAGLEAKWKNRTWHDKAFVSKEKFKKKYTQEIVKQKFEELLKPFDGLRVRNIRAALVDDKKEALKTNISNLMTIFSEHFADLEKTRFKAIGGIANKQFNLISLELERISKYVTDKQMVVAEEEMKKLERALKTFYSLFDKDSSEDDW